MSEKKKEILTLRFSSDIEQSLPAKLCDNTLPPRLQSRHRVSGDVIFGDILLRRSDVVPTLDYARSVAGLPEDPGTGEVDASPIYLRVLVVTRPKLLELYQEDLWALGSPYVHQLMVDEGLMDSLPLDRGEGPDTDFGLDILGFERRADELREMIHSCASERLKEYVYRASESRAGRESLTDILPVGEIHSAVLDKNTMEVKIFTGVFPTVKLEDLLSFRTEETLGGAVTKVMDVYKGAVIPFSCQEMPTIPYPEGVPELFPGMLPDKNSSEWKSLFGLNGHFSGRRFMAYRDPGDPTWRFALSYMEDQCVLVQRGSYLHEVLTAMHRLFERRLMSPWGWVNHGVEVTVFPAFEVSPEEAPMGVLSVGGKLSELGLRRISATARNRTAALAWLHERVPDLADLNRWTEADLLGLLESLGLRPSTSNWEHYTTEG